MQRSQSLAFCTFFWNECKKYCCETCYKSWRNPNCTDLIISNSSSRSEEYTIGLIRFSRNGFNCFKRNLSKISTKGAYFTGTAKTPKAGISLKNFVVGQENFIVRWNFFSSIPEKFNNRMEKKKMFLKSLHNFYDRFV